MYILGIDPGLAIVGWAVIEYNRGRIRPIDFGALRTPAHTPTEDRLLSIYRQMNEIIEKYKPERMSIEELFFNTNQTTAIAVAEARGVILLSAREHGLIIHEYTPLQVKQSVVGYGRAEKHQVISMVTAMLGLPKPPKPDDTADAIALAICDGNSGSSILKDLTKYQ